MHDLSLVASFHNLTSLLQPPQAVDALPSQARLGASAREPEIRLDAVGLRVGAADIVGRLLTFLDSIHYRLTYQLHCCGRRDWSEKGAD